MLSGSSSREYIKLYSTHLEILEAQKTLERRSVAAHSLRRFPPPSPTAPPPVPHTSHLTHLTPHTKVGHLLESSPCICRFFMGVSRSFAMPLTLGAPTKGGEFRRGQRCCCNHPLFIAPLYRCTPRRATPTPRHVALRRATPRESRHATLLSTLHPQPYTAEDGKTNVYGPKVLEFRKPITFPICCNIYIPTESGIETCSFPCCCLLPALETYNNENVKLGSTQ